LRRFDEAKEFRTMVKSILRWAVALSATYLSFAAQANAPQPQVRRISVMATGKILLDRDEVTIAELKKALERVKTQRGIVWYYRESGKGDPPEQAIEVFNLIVEHKVPVSLSTRPDFSDFVDEEGRSQPRHSGSSDSE
jgi:GTP cyclohydrolase II